MKTISAAVAPDVVSDLLAAVRVRTTIYCRSDMRAPWGFGVEAHGNPSFHVVGAESAPAAWVAASLDLVAAVTASNAPGTEAVMTRVADTMLTQALRLELASTDGPQARALRDPQVGTAVHLIHSRPEEPW